ncbi:MAG: DNRLRE domain-containing protein [Ginsengibacter sp.]
MKLFYLSLLLFFNTKPFNRIRKPAFLNLLKNFCALLMVSVSQVNAQDFSTISWTTGTSQPYTVSEAQGRVVNDKLYSFGGFDSRKSTFTPTKRSYVFDPALNTWTSIADLPFTPVGTNFGGVTHAGITTDGNDIYLAGGYTSNTAGTGQIFGTKQVWKYNVLQDNYTSLPDLPVAIASGQLEYLGGKLHYIGGTNSARTVDLSTHYVLDLNNLNAGWQTKAPLPNGRNHAGSAVYNGKIYFVGGQHGQDSKLVTQKEMDVYDAITDTWTRVADIPVPAGTNGRGHISSGVTVMGNRILVLGGETVHQTSISMVSAYSPATDTWENLTPLPQNRFSGVAGNIGGIVYYTGGSYSKTTFKGTPVVQNGITTLTPLDDAFVRDGSYSSKNYGSETSLLVKNASSSYTRNSYLKFSLAGINNVGSAKLRIYGFNSDNSGDVLVNVHAANNDNWSEATLNYSNSPSAAAAPLNSFLVNNTAEYHDIDITSYIQAEASGDKIASLVLQDPAGNKALVDFSSKENSLNSPQLIITTNANTTTNTLYAVADAHTRDGAYSNSNYGTEDLLLVKKASSGFTRETFLKFSLANVAGVNNAKLRLYGRNADNTNTIKLNVYGVNDDSWTETGIAYANAPATTTTPLGEVSITAVQQYYEVDITAFVQTQFNSDKVVSLVLKDPALNKLVMEFNSRENSVNQAELIITSDASTILNNSFVTVESPHRLDGERPLVFPNPSNGKFMVQFSDHFSGEAIIKLYDLSGKSYPVEQFHIPHGGLDVDVNLSRYQLKPGVYYLKIKSGEGYHTIPIVIQ